MTLPGLLEQALAQFALHAGWQVPLLGGAAWCAVRTGRPGVRAAHGIWLATLLLCVALPVCSTAGGWRAALLAQRDGTATIGYEPSSYTGDLPAFQREPPWLRAFHRHASLHDGLQPFAWTPSPRTARAIALGYLLLTAAFVLQLLCAWRRMRALVRRSSTLLSPSVRAGLQQLCSAQGISVPDARSSSEVPGPALAGVLRPVLLLPEGNAVAESELQAVLAHEVAHLRRHDPLLHAACSLLLLPLAFHPAAWWVSRAIRQTREMACDAEAAGQMGSASAYARALLRVAEQTGARGLRRPVPGFFSNGFAGDGLQLFNRNGSMEERMQMLMNPRHTDARGRRAVRVLACVSLGSAAVLAAGMLQVRPALAGERALPQAVPQAVATQDADSAPRLLGGDHAREQLRNARRELAVAERSATTDEDRRRIATARDVAAAAEHAIAAAGGTRRDTSEDLAALGSLDVDLSSLKVDVAAMQQLTLTLQSKEWQTHMEAQRKAMQQLQAQLNSPEWKERMRQQGEAIAKATAQIDSPEFRAKIEAASRIDTAKMSAMLAAARKQQERAMEGIPSGAMERQLAEAARLTARNGVPPVPAAQPAAPALPAAGNAVSADPIKISSGVMAANNLTKKMPVYPPEAKEKNIQGEVLLHAIISEMGKVEQLQVVSSPDESLSKSALEAVREWVYKPYLLNGDPRAVDTTINVHYSLGQ